MLFIVLVGLFTLGIAWGGAVIAAHYAFTYNTPKRESMWSVAAFLVHDIGALNVIYVVNQTPDWPYAMMIGAPAYIAALFLTTTGHFISQYRVNRTKPALA